MEARHTLRRAGALLALYARLDLLYVVRGWQEALAWYVSDLLTVVAGVTATFLLAARFDGIGRWSYDEVLFLLGFAMTARAGVHFFFAANVAYISRIVGRGQLDHRLVQPQPLWLTLATEGFAPATASGPLLAGVALLVYAVGRLDVAITPGWLALLTLNLAASVCVLLAFAFAWGSLAFWAPRGAEEINSQSMRFMNQLSVFPLDGLGAAFQLGLLTAVPVGFVAWYPARALVGRGGELGALVAPVAALAFAALALALFVRGLGQYHHTGSVRYVDLGHRR